MDLGKKPQDLYFNLQKHFNNFTICYGEYFLSGYVA
jgi:hypothetical protein